MWYLLFSENNHHYIITIKCLALSNVYVSTFKYHRWQELRVAIGSSQKCKHMPPLHRNITKCVCLCVCVASSYSTVFCFTLSNHLKAPLPSTPASDAFLCHFFLNTHHLSINSPSVFPIYLTLTCTNTHMHALRSSKTRKRAIKCHVATATRPSEERHSHNDPRDHLWLPPSALPQPIMTSLSHLHGDRRLY